MTRSINDRPRSFVTSKQPNVSKHIFPASTLPLPPTVWLEIIQYLPPESTKDLALTSQSLRWFAQPFLFCEITLHRIVLDRRRCRYRQPSAVTTGQIMHRLRFLQEDRIACAVRECSIGTVPWQPEDALDSSDLTSDGWDSDSDSEEDYDEDVSSRVVRSIFLALPRFRNMRRLEITQVYVDRILCKMLCDLTQVEELHVRSCTMHPSDVPSGALRVPRITYSEVNEIHGAVVPNYRWDQWMKLIGSDTIFHSMTFLGMDDLYMEESILRPLAELDPIPLVVRLNISVSRHIMSFLPSILSRLRTLEALILQPASPHVPVPPTDTFVHSSSLRSYDGPLALFRSFSCIETLAQVSLAHTMQARGPSELDPLCEVLSSAPGLHGRLTHLQIKSHLTLWRLRTLCALFPNLTVLEFRSKYASHGLNRKALIPVLYELSLPTRIEELSIRIQSKEGSMDVGAGVETPEGTALVQHLGGEYPTLQSFELSDEVFGKPWTRPFVSSHPRQDQSEHTFPASAIPLLLEIWLEIVQYLSPESTENLALTSQSLRWLAQPFLFGDITLHRIVLDRRRWCYRLPPVDTVVKITQRLRFLEDPRIARAIHKCRIATSSWRGDEDLDSSDNEEAFDEELSLYVVQSTFLALPRFRNMRQLNLTGVYFDQALAHMLCDLPQVEELQLWNCIMHDSDVSVGALRVPYISYQESRGGALSEDAIPNYRFDQWMRMFNQETLLSLSFFGLPEPRIQEGVLRVLAHAEPTVLPRVTRLSVPAIEHLWHFIPWIIPRLSSLGELMLPQGNHIIPIPPTDFVVPSSSLRAYLGGVELFPPFSAIATLTQVSLVHTTQRPSDPDPVCEVLSAATSLHERLTHLRIVSHITLRRLRTFCTLFPNLVVLKLRANRAFDGLNREALIPELYELPLPPKIEEVSIQIQFEEGVGAGIETPEGTALVHYLGTTYPTLQSFELVDEVFGKSWTRPFITSKQPDAHILPASTPPLPPTVWQEIAHYLSPESTRSLALTSQSLRFLAQPFLFREIAIHHILLDRRRGRSRYRHPAIAVTGQVIERLRFLETDRIACAVRKCSIATVPWLSQGALDMSWDGWDSDEDSEDGYDEDTSAYVVRSVFMALPQFRNMRRLEMTHVYFDRTLCKGLCELKQVEELHLRSCTMHNADVPTGALRVPHILYSEMNEVRGGVVPNYRWDQWMKLIGPNTVFESMTFFGMDDLYMEESILRMLADLDPMPLVVRLNVSVTEHLMSFIPSILPRLRTLEALVLEPAELNAPDPPTDIVVHSPSLTSYDGPLSLFRPFSHIQTLTHVSLVDTAQELSTGRDPLCDVLSAAAGLHARLTHLQIASYLTPQRLHTLCALFPNLAVLKLRSKPTAHSPNREALIPVLHDLSLPPKIAEVSIRIQSKEGLLDSSDGIETPKGAALVQHLWTRYPTLQSFELADELFGRPWTRSGHV